MSDWDNDNNQPDDEWSDDDFDWLDDDDDTGEDTGGDDDFFDEFDWDAEDGESGASDANRTGLTGNLDWQQGDDDADTSSGDVDDDFDWDFDDADDSDDGSADATDEDEAMPWQMERADRAEQRVEQQMQEAEDADFGNTDDLLDWMQNPDDEPDDAADSDDVPADAADADDDLPAWMHDMDVPDASTEEVDAARASVQGDSSDEDAFDDFSDEADDVDADDLWGAMDAEDDAFSGEPADSSDADEGFAWDVEGEDTGDTADDEASVNFDDMLAGSADDTDDSDTDFLNDLADTGDIEGDSEFFNSLTDTGDLDSDSDFFNSLTDTGDLDDEGDAFLDDSQTFKPSETDESSGWNLEPAADDDTGDELPMASDDEPTDDFDDLFGDISGGDDADAISDDDAAAAQADADFEAMFDDFEYDEQDDPGTGDLGITDAMNAMFGEDDADDLDAAFDDLDAADDAGTDADDLDAMFADMDTGDLQGALEDEDAGTGDLGITDAMDAMFAGDVDEDDLDADDFEWEDVEGSATDDLSWLDDVDAEEYDADADDITEEDALADELLAELGDAGDDDLDALLADLDEGDDDDLDALLADLDDDDISLDDLEGELEGDAVSEDDLAALLEGEEDAEPVAETAPPDDEFDFSDEDDSELDDDVVLEEADDDWLSQIQLDDLEAEDEPELEENDLDALLASYELDDDLSTDELGTNTEDVDIEQADDLDAIFGELGGVGDDDQDDIPIDKPDTGSLEEVEGIPDWLREAAASTDDTSAAALVRQRGDRPLDDLDDRLLDLRERGLELEEVDEDTASYRRFQEVVPNAPDALAPARIETGESDLTPEPTVTDTEREQATLMASLVGAGALGAAGTDAEAAARVSRRREQSRLAQIPWFRIVLMVFLLLAVALPFYLPVDFGGTPPIEFDGGSPQAEIFFRMENLSDSARVLVAAEYGAAGSQELDDLTRTLLEHLFVRDAQPVIVSGNPVGLLRAENIAAELVGEDARNSRFYAARYLPGSALGLRELTTSPQQVLSISSRGDNTGLNVSSLDEFELIIVISDSGETVRAWVEQVNPTTSTPFVLAVGQSARPLAAPYVDLPDVIGMLVGYTDAYTYNAMNIAFNGDPTPPPSATPTPSPTPTSTSTSTPTPLPTDTPTATNTPEPGVTSPAFLTQQAQPTDTPTPTATATSTPLPVEFVTSSAEPPTETPLPTNTPTETPVPIIEVATIVGDGTVNVRSEPNSNSEVVTGAAPGERFRVLESQQGDQFNWVQIQLDDETTGWVADFLVTIEEVDAAEFEAEQIEGDAAAPRRKVFAKRNPRDIQQDTDATFVRIGTNVAGVPFDIYVEPDFNSEIVGQLDARAEVLVLEDDGEFTRIQTPEEQSGYVETRILDIQERPLSEVDFVPTPTPTLTPTATLTPTQTLTPTPTNTPAPVITPAPLQSGGTITTGNPRYTAFTLGLVASILLIALGNIYWIVRWLRGRND